MERSNAWALRVVPFEAQALEETSAASIVLALYDTERIPLTRYLVFLGMDMEASRDVVQDAFLKLHEHVAGGGDRSQLRAWLYRVAHNLAQNRRRGAHASRVEALDASEAARYADVTQLSPEAALLHRERDAALSQAMLNLSAARRECLVLRSQGFRYREIAGILDASISTVAEHVQKGIEQIKRDLEKGRTGL
jgi:RNA polymerase sigma-70 factor (ECF subfamily)